MEVKDVTTAQPTPVQQQRRQITIDALVAASRQGVIEYGMGVSMDQIAELAQVGRRTAFRYFATREDLISAGLATVTRDLLLAMPEYTGGDWRTWLADVVRLRHQTTVRGGRIYWEMTVQQLPERVARAVAEHRGVLRGIYTMVSTTIWHAAGGEGDPPQRLYRTVAAHMSPLFTQAVVLDADGTPELAAEMATDAIIAAVRT
ncbi:TetR/AcrR family transcriptional regulator [Pseudonocardiaceae bacterium YIM PH 21723]|nr:TetR/AcrR family transcriptional regulator [Pseudonocardiaceae bacterium YIM PH 21723]